MSGTIFGGIADLAQLVSPPEAWSFLSPVRSMRHLCMDTEELANSLRQNFTEEQLEAARVFVRQRDGDLAMSPILTGQATQALFLRRAQNELPFDIVNQHGSMATDDPPAFTSCNDFFTKTWSGNANVILTTFSDDDLAVSRMLSLPCTPAAGLATMNGQHVRSLFGDEQTLQSATSTQVPTADVTSNGYRLTLLGWRLAELVNEEPKGLNAVASRLVKAEDAFGFSTSKRVGIWQPTPSEFSRIASAVEFADRTLLRNTIWRSISRSTHTVRVYSEQHANREPSDYNVARRELLRTISRDRKNGFQSPETIKRLEALNRSFDQSVIDPIIDDAILAGDSIDRSLLLAAADLMGHWHRSSPLARSTEDGTTGRFRQREEELDPEELKERLNVVDGIVKIHRELTRKK